ncbi:MAG: MMPL family transporter [Chloroflexi bacterium]|nr:MAG: MMPL family transporter [Chloroflexota bacterium]
MFSRWGAFVYRFRKPVALVAIAVALLASSVAGKAASVLSAGGWLDPTSESTTVNDRLATEFGAGHGTLIAVFHGPPGSNAASDAFQSQLGTALTALRTDSRVAGIVGYSETHDQRFISTNGQAAYVVIQLYAKDEDSVAFLDDLRSRIATPAGFDLKLAGYGPITKDSVHQAEKELIQAETVSLPIAGLILILVFASVVAAGMPLLVAGLAIPTTLAMVWLVAQQVQLSIYVQNVSTMLGLALAIDYSLFMVSRFREELRRGRTVAEAVEVTVATSGKAVAFSGAAVAIGLSGLLLFEAPALRSFGIGGALVVGASVFYALTFLPAMLGMLGPRVNALNLVDLFDRLRARLGLRSRAVSERVRRSRWERVAHLVMARPLLVLIPVLAILLAAGTPFLHLKQGIPDASVLPPGLESREAAVALQDEFRPGETSPVTILADVSGSPTDPANIQALTAYADAIARVPGIDRVEGPFSLVDPTSGVALKPEQVAQLYALPKDQRPAQISSALDALSATYIRGQTVRLDAVSPLQPVSPDGTSIIPPIRAIQPGTGITAQVGGFAATGYDFNVSQAASIPWAVGVTLLASALILFLLFGSLAIPVKAVIMTLLSITASFGALVWIFQDGNLGNILQFQSPGFTIAGNPIIMFSVLFGLSMDYEVLLLSRIQEAYRRSGDNRASVAEGLAKTAGVITGAALIMVTVFSAFALAESITIKSIGVGMAIAVFIDATIIRILLVPATMRLLGRWNWWAPGPLGRLADRLGFSHVEDEPSIETGGAPPAAEAGHAVG